MNYSIYNKSTGQIDKVCTCDAELIFHQYDPSIYSHIEGVFMDDEFYVSDGVAVAMGGKPSPSHIFNYTTKQWEDPRTLQDLKDAQWEKIKQARTQAEYAGFTCEGSTFDSDAISQQRITGAVALAQMAVASGAPFTIDWTLADNSTRTLSGMDMMQVGVALGGHVQTQFAKGVLLRAQIDAATTQAEVEAVVW